jgi:hypothetical protein
MFSPLSAQGTGSFGWEIAPLGILLDVQSIQSILQQFVGIYSHFGR